MKIYQITIDGSPDALEMYCAMDGFDDIFDNAERDYANGVDANHCEALFEAINCMSEPISKEFAFGYDDEPGIVPEHPCIFDCDYYYWVADPLKWGDDPEAPWNIDVNIGYGTTISICTEDNVMERHVQQWLIKTIPSVGSYNVQIEYCGDKRLDEIKSPFHGWNERLSPLSVMPPR